MCHGRHFILPIIVFSMWAVSAFGGNDNSVIARSSNFVAIAPTSEVAEKLLAEAETRRKRIAETWLGEELRPGAGRTLITLRISDAQERVTSSVDEGCGSSSYCIWITTNEANIAPILSRELHSIVLATKFPGQIPAWVHLGIRSKCDDNEHVQVDTRGLREFNNTNCWPNLISLLIATRIPKGDDAAYAAAASFVDFLLIHGNERELIQFAIEGRQRGWDDAAAKHYPFQSIEQLDSAWRSWARGRQKASFDAQERGAQFEQLSTPNRSFDERSPIQKPAELGIPKPVLFVNP